MKAIVKINNVRIEVDTDKKGKGIQLDGNGKSREVEFSTLLHIAFGNSKTNKMEDEDIKMVEELDAIIKGRDEKIIEWEYDSDNEVISYTNSYWETNLFNVLRVDRICYSIDLRKEIERLSTMEMKEYTFDGMLTEKKVYKITNENIQKIKEMYESLKEEIKNSRELIKQMENGIEKIDCEAIRNMPECVKTRLDKLPKVAKVLQDEGYVESVPCVDVSNEQSDDFHCYSTWSWKK